VIATALNNYEWAILMVSHDEHFLSQLDNVEKVELGRLVGR
jgi:ATPase subunit of ABC transporter with duplicated ATPase domains